MKVSTLILAFNEESNLPACLSSLCWCDDIVVVDSGSTDATVQIARQHGARVLVRAFDNFAGQRNFGLDVAEFRHDWILHLDADEIATVSFAQALSQLDPAEGIDAYWVPSKTMLFGRWLRHAGMYPTYQVRLGHATRLRFKQIGHGQREDLLPERIGVFGEPYLHYSFSHGLKAWLEKHLRYAHDEAIQLMNDRREGARAAEGLLSSDSTVRRRALKGISTRLPLLLRPAFRLLYICIGRMAFLDGYAGIVYAFMLATYEGMIAILAIEIQQEKRSLAGTERLGEKSVPTNHL